MEGYFFELFAVLLWIPVVVTLEYLLQIKVDYFGNFAACRVAAYCSVFQNVHRLLKSPWKSLNSKVTEEYSELCNWLESLF